MRESPAHDLPRAAVDHTYQVCPAYGGTGPDLGHVRLPDLILRIFVKSIRVPVGKGVQLASQQPSQRKGHGANLRNEGIRPVGAKTTLVLSQTLEGIFS